MFRAGGRDSYLHLVLCGTVEFAGNIPAAIDGVGLIQENFVSVGISDLEPNRSGGVAVVSDCQSMRVDIVGSFTEGERV